MSHVGAENLRGVAKSKGEDAPLKNAERCVESSERLGVVMDTKLIVAALEVKGRKNFGI